MTTGMGVDPTKNGSGVITSGTSSQDIRQIYGGLFTPGVVSGCVITTSPSAMTYTVSAGVAMLQTAAGQIVPIPVPAQTITALSAPSSGARTDVIYAKQRFPAIDGDSEVIVSYGTSAPTNSVVLRTYNQPAGASNTNAGTVSGSVNYSIPYGASLGNLYTYQHTANGQLPDSLTRYGYGTFYLPTDRRVHLKVTSVLYAMGAVGFDNAHYAEYGFLPNIDGGDYVLWSSPGLGQAWATYNFDLYINLNAGLHTVNLGFLKLAGGTTHAATAFGTDSLGFGRRGITFTIEDAGVTV